jgi:hypothetical protein
MCCADEKVPNLVRKGFQVVLELNLTTGITTLSCGSDGHLLHASQMIDDTRIVVIRGLTTLQNMRDRRFSGNDSTKHCKLKKVSLHEQ